MSWIDITQTIVAVLLAIIPGIAYPYLRDYAGQKKHELQRFRKEMLYENLVLPQLWRSKEY